MDQSIKRKLRIQKVMSAIVPWIAWVCHDGRFIVYGKTAEDAYLRWMRRHGSNN